MTEHTAKGFPGLSRAQAGNIGYTLRRHFVDQFHLREVAKLPKGTLVLDVGGARLMKRGLFDISNYDLDVINLNYSMTKSPDVQGDGAAMPFGKDVFDAVICSEVLEHVFSPKLVLAECCRTLKPAGKFLMCAPFLNKIHGDPCDYGRYTGFFWLEALERAGFTDIQVEKQGLFWSVMLDEARDYLYVKDVAGKGGIRGKAAQFLFGLGRRAALKWDGKALESEDDSLSAYTTGFGVTAVKNGSRTLGAKTTHVRRTIGRNEAT